MNNDELVYVGIKGTVLALFRTTGEVKWQTLLKKRCDFVHLVLDGENIFATTAGEVFCLNAKTGDGVWQNPLKGYGLGIASLVTRNCPGNTGVNLAMEEYVRAQQAAQAAIVAQAT